MSAPVQPSATADRAHLPPLGIRDVLRRYQEHHQTPAQVLAEVIDAIEAGDPGIFIDRVERDVLARRAAELAAVPDGPNRLPLFGVPFAVKDNIDVAGRATTAACPEFATTAARSASAVTTLEQAGAVFVGKTNLDQFATGLVGTRSPYGVPRNPRAPHHVPGGSSSGSAVAVAGGLVPFTLGTDTAGSGRVPAAMTGILGLKPTRGIVSTSGVVPACRSLDCVSVFATSASDAAAVLAVLDRYDPEDAWARRPGDRQLRPADRIASLRVGVPELPPTVDPLLAAAFDGHVKRLRVLGLTPETIDLAPFADAGELLYAGPWLAERLAAVGAFVRAHPEAVLEVTREVLEGGWRFTAVDAFQAADELTALRRAADAVFAQVDLLALPSVPTLLTLDDVSADPIGANARLGEFTNFVNLLDLAAVAVPAGHIDGVPVGITLLGPALTDPTLLAVARAYGDEGPSPVATSTSADVVELAVVGAHLRGQPLHHQLVAAGARLVDRTTTAPHYRLYLLDGGDLPKPGLVVGTDGAAIEVEVYELPATQVPVLRERTPAPLSIGEVTLADGTQVLGFVCDPAATDPGRDITHHGGWRGFLAQAVPAGSG